MDDVPLAVLDGQGTRYLHTSHLGTPLKATDASGNSVWAADYEPFGRATVAHPATALNLRFPGQYFDAETGLHYNMARHYDPGIGRYLQSDPIGLEGGINTYVYVEDNPMNFVDPLGLFGSGYEGGMSCLTCHLRDWFDPPPVPTKPEPWLMPAPGNQVDTQISDDYARAVSEAILKRCPPPEKCKWLEENSGKYRPDQVKPTAKAWGCTGSRWTKGGKSR